jgi:hypothetical protein
VFEKYDGGGRRNQRSKERIIRRQNENKNRNGRIETKAVFRTSEYGVCAYNVE